MDFNNDHFDKIEDYLLGKLPADQSAAFEKELAGSDKLREQLDMVRFEIETREYLLEQDLRDQMADWEKNPLPPESPNWLNRGLWFSLLGVVLVGGYFLLLNQEEAPAIEEEAPIEKNIPNDTPSDVPIANDETGPSDQEDDSGEELPNDIIDTPEKQTPSTNNRSAQLAALEGSIKSNIYEIPSSLLDDSGVRGSDGTPQKDTLSLGIIAFSDQDFKRVIELFEPIDPIKQQQLYDAGKERLAHAYFMQGQYPSAAKIFRAILRERRFGKDVPEWYFLLSLAADYENTTVETDSLLKAILTRTKHVKMEEVQSLNDQINAIQ